MDDEPENALVDKYFDRVINATDFNSLRQWLREQDPDEIEIFANFWNWDNCRAQQAIVQQEIKRLRSEQEERLMARRSAPSTPRPAELTLDQKRQAVRRLERLVERLRQFDPNTLTDRYGPEVTELSHAVQTAVEKTYQVGTTEHSRLISASYLDTASINMNYETPIGEVRDGFATGRDKAIIMLKEEIASLNEDLEELPTSVGTQLAQASSRSIFVVHGHDEAARETVAAFLRKLELIPIILHEHANEGRTIIEKFEDKSGDVGFAVILLTPDDLGSIKGGQSRPRARQNVILELGFFVGKLGRHRVCAMKKGDVEVPTDYIGVGYIDLDQGGWKFELAREIKAAGIDVDLNKAI